MSRPQFAVVGEALIDLVVDGSAAPAAHPGGSPANVALGLSRLGAEVTLLTSLGDDDHGRRLASHLIGNGVALAPDVVGAAPTSVATAHLDAAGVATYDFDITWQLPQATALPAGVACLHTGSLGAFLEPGASVVRRLVADARGSATVSYDPNCRPALMGSPDDARRAVEDMVGRADVVKASSEDLEWLYGDADLEDVTRRWLALGPSVVVVTLGRDGALALAAGGMVRRPALDVKLVDTVGAGDAFMSGLLDGLRLGGLLGASPREELRGIGIGALAAAVDRGILTSAITCARAGANPPTAAEVDSAAVGRG